MYITYTAEQERSATAAAAVLRRPDDSGASRTAHLRRRRVRWRRAVARIGRARWGATAGSRSGGRRSTAGQARSMMDQLIFTDEASIAGVPMPLLTINTVGAHAHAYGTDGAEARTSCRGSATASCTSRSATPSRTPAPIWPACAPAPRADGGRVRHQRPEDVDEPDPVRRLRLAGLPYRPRCPPPQGALGHHACRPPPRAFAGRRCAPSAAPTTSPTFYTDVRVPVGNLVGPENEGWQLITNQLNHERVALLSAAPIHAVAGRGPRVGPGHQAPRRPPGDRRRSGCRPNLAGSTPRSSS